LWRKTILKAGGSVLVIIVAHKSSNLEVRVAGLGIFDVVHPITAVPPITRENTIITVQNGNSVNFMGYLRQSNVFTATVIESKEALSVDNKGGV